MAFTRVVGPGIHSLSNIDSHNIHSSGIITATKFDGPFDSINVSGAATFTGNVTIGGTLTYEDVKNVDSVGLITARKGIISSGVVTATAFHGPSQIGIQSAGTQIGAGITQLNFIGTGNTFSVSGTTVDISISGGSAGAGGTWGSNAVGVHTDKIVGINTSTIVGSATSEGALQVTGNIGITEGLLTLDSNLYTSVSVPSGKNALLIGPTTVAVGATIDVAQGSTLVVV